MLNIFACLGGLVIILLLSELIFQNKILKGENERKFVHICAGTFIAFWPWLISWKSIQLIGMAMIIVVLLNRTKDYLHILGGVRTRYYGDVFLALAVVLTAMLTTNKVFFAIAILNISLADGFAAIIGVNFGKNWAYKVFGQTKTVLGTMTFWVVSLTILGIAVPLANGAIPYNHYVWLLVLLPPFLTFLENISIWGTDNIVLPVAVIGALNLAAGMNLF
jgi:phytol kinase